MSEQKKYIIIGKIFDHQIPINTDGKIIVFDSIEDANELIDSSYLSIIKEDF